MISLTKRELDILPLLAMGKAASVVGNMLGISESAVYQHSTNLVYKFGAQNKTGMVVKAALMGWLKIDGNKIEINSERIKKVEHAEACKGTA